MRVTLCSKGLRASGCTGVRLSNEGGGARLALLLLFAVPTGLQAQAPPNVTPPPDDSVYALAVHPVDYPGQDYVMLLDDGLAVVESDGRASYTLRQVAQVLTSDGAAVLGEFAFGYTPGRQNLRINWMRVIADGTVQQDGPEHQVESDAGTFPGVPVYSEHKIVQATLAGVAPGVIVDYSWTVETFSPRLAGDVLYEWSVNYDVPVVHSRFVLDAPADLALRVKELNLSIPADTTTVAGRLLRTWQLENLPAVEYERFLGFPNDVLMSIKIVGAISWDDIGAWYAELLRDRFEVADELAAAFADVVEGAQTLEDSLRTAYRWVAQDFRYVALTLGDGGYQPRVPLEVYRTRFGDCKDKAALFVALAREMDLHAHPVLVSSGGIVDSLLPSIKQFDHMIAAVERDGRVDYLDLTAWLAPYGELPFALQGSVGLAFHDDGAARVIVLPASDPVTNRLEQEIVGTVRHDGTFVGSVTVSAMGTEQYELRASFIDFRDLDESEQHDVLQEWGGTWDTAIIDSSRVYGGRDLEADARMTIWITAPNAVYSAGDHYMMSLPLASLGSAALVTSLESSGERRFPIDIAMVNSPSVHRYSLDVALPEGWTARVPESVRVKGPFGYYRGEYEQVGARFRASREMGGLRGLLPPDSVEALIAWARGVSEDATEYIIFDRTGGPVLGAAAMVPDTSSDLARLLPVSEDLGEGVMLAAEGPAEDAILPDLYGARVMASWARQFAAEQMVFTVGSSRFVSLRVAATEFDSHAGAAKTLRFSELLDIQGLFQLSFEQQGIEQTTVGEARPMDLAALGEDARGWTMEIVTPLSTFDIALLMHARGRVSVGLVAVGPQGMKTEDLERLARMVDERILQNGNFLADLDSEPQAVAQGAETEGPTVAERADGVALDEMLPRPEDLPGSVLSREGLTRAGGAPFYEREFEGLGFTFPVGGSEVIWMSLDVTLHPTEALAMREVLDFERELPAGELLEAMKGAELGSEFFPESESSFRRLDVPSVGSRAIGLAGQFRGAMRLDMGGIVFMAGRLVAKVMLVTTPDGLDATAMNSLAEDIHQRMLRVAPDVAVGVIGEGQAEAFERMTAIQQEVDSLVDERAFDSVFAAIERADLPPDGPGTFGPDMWNKICWYASLHGFAERAIPACEAAVAPDTTNVNIRDSRGLARALVGDTQGAIEDFRFVVEHAEGEFLETRTAWLEALLAGKNPFTAEVMRRLRGW